MKIKKENVAIYVSIFALLLSIASFFVLWKDFLVKNRPYIKITPMIFEDTKQFYKIENIDQTTYALIFRFQMKNVGSVPANSIYVDHTIVFPIKELSVKDIKGERIKKVLGEIERSDVVEHIQLPVELIDDKGLENLLEELRSKDVTLSRLYRRWKVLSLFPGDSFEYMSGAKVSGKDVGWFLKNFDKLKFSQLEVKVTYRGILSKMGRSYYSIYKGEFEKGELFPYETVSY